MEHDCRPSLHGFHKDSAVNSALAGIRVNTLTEQSIYTHKYKQPMCSRIRRNTRNELTKFIMPGISPNVPHLNDNDARLARSGSLKHFGITYFIYTQLICRDYLKKATTI